MSAYHARRSRVLGRLVHLHPDEYADLMAAERVREGLDPAPGAEKVAKCGTRSGAAAHRKRNEEVCSRCAEADRNYGRSRPQGVSVEALSLKPKKGMMTMHHQTAKAAYRILGELAELVDERGFSKAPTSNGRLTVLQALGRATQGKSPTAAVEAQRALEKEVGNLAAWEPRDKRSFIARVNAAAKALAKTEGINLEKV